MPSTRRTALVATLLATLLPALPALGVADARAQTPYTSRADFLAAFPGQTAANSLNGFDVSGGGINPVAGIAFGPITGTLSAPPGALSELNFAALGDDVSWIVADGGVTRLSLDGPVLGAGATFFDPGSAGDVIFRLLDEGASTDLVGEFRLSALPGFVVGVGYTGFLGIASALPFNVLEIEAAPGDFFELDDPVVAGVGTSAVPEPATAALMAGGLALVGLAGRRRAAARTRA